MSEVLIVLQREFLERVRGRSFLLSTVLIPLFVGGLTLLPVLMGTGGGERSIVVVDEAPAGIGDAMVAALARPAPPVDADAYTYRVEHARGPLAARRAALNRRVLAEEIDAWVHLPPDVARTNVVEYRARSLSSFTVEGDVRRAASQAVQAARLHEQGLDVAEVVSLLRPVEVRTARVTERGEEAGSARSTFFLGYVLGFMVYMLVLLYGINVMRSVLEEKTNRIAEVIVSSMKATHLMAGKILGVGAVALLQVSIWTAMGALTASRSDTIARRFGLPPDALSFSADPWMLASALGFFLLGFFLYAALFAAVGAAVNSEQEAQQFQTVALLPLIAPMIFITQVISEPLGTTATVLGLIPFTAPVTMPMRLAAAAVPAWQVAASLAGTLAMVLLVAWLAGKIYRIGILSTGKRPTLRELGHWLRAA